MHCFKPFTSAVTPEGPGDLPTWSPSSATLVYGDHDAILVDTLITHDQVDALADWIGALGRRPSRIYITHGHGDHWLGLARLIQRFPGVTGLATGEVLAQAADPGMAGYWEAIFPGEIPGAGERVLPRLLTTGTLNLGIVVAGHKKVDNDNHPKIIGESQQYLRDFTRIAAGETTTAGIVTRM